LEKHIDSGLQEMPPVFIKSIEILRELFNLNDNALKLIDHIYIFSTFKSVWAHNGHDIILHGFAGRDVLATILQMSRVELIDAIDTLEDLCILQVTNTTMEFSSENIIRLWEIPEETKAHELFCRSLVGETLPLSDFTIPKNDLNFLVNLLKTKGPKAHHILIYGPPERGKSTFVRSLSKYLGVKAWTVLPENSTDANFKRRISLNVCVNRASCHPGSLVVVDEAENLLTSNSVLSDKIHSTRVGSMNFLKSPGGSFIWIVNYPERIDATVKRRFGFSMYFGSLSAKIATAAVEGNSKPSWSR
jgi:hypothetical protein